MQSLLYGPPNFLVDGGVDPSSSSTHSIEPGETYISKCGDSRYYVIDVEPAHRIEVNGRWYDNERRVYVVELGQGKHVSTTKMMDVSQLRHLVSCGVALTDEFSRQILRVMDERLCADENNYANARDKLQKMIQTKTGMESAFKVFEHYYPKPTGWWSWLCGDGYSKAQPPSPSPKLLTQGPPVLKEIRDVDKTETTTLRRVKPGELYYYK